MPERKNVPAFRELNPQNDIGKLINQWDQFAATVDRDNQPFRHVAYEAQRARFLLFGDIRGAAENENPGAALRVLDEGVDLAADLVDRLQLFLRILDFIKVVTHPVF